jgi:hypothetical protein
MSRDIFKERERGFEEEFFIKQDARLIEKIRERAKLEEIAQALAEKLQVDNPELLRRVIELGVTRDSGSAFLAAPLVQIAWAGGSVTQGERETLLRLAAARGVEEGSPAHAKLIEWLDVRPDDQFFETGLEALRVGLSVLPPEEREERIKGILENCKMVAEASGGLAKKLGLASGVSGEEELLLETIGAKLRAQS